MRSENRLGDRMVAAVRDYILNDAFFGLIGVTGAARRRRPLDFIGINYYTRNIVRRRGLGLGALVGHVCTSRSPRPRCAQHDGLGSLPAGNGIHARALRAYTDYRSS